jgi:hypothetical protein
MKLVALLSSLLLISNIYAHDVVSVTATTQGIINVTYSDGTSGSTTMPSTLPIVESLESRLLHSYDTVIKVGADRPIKTAEQVEAKLTDNDAVLIDDGYVMPTSDGFRLAKNNIYVGAAKGASVKYTGTTAR